MLIRQPFTQSKPSHFRPSKSHVFFSESYQVPPSLPVSNQETSPFSLDCFLRLQSSGCKSCRSPSLQWLLSVFSTSFVPGKMMFASRLGKHDCFINPTRSSGLIWDVCLRIPTQKLLCCQTFVRKVPLVFPQLLVPTWLVYSLSLS